MTRFAHFSAVFLGILAIPIFASSPVRRNACRNIERLSPALKIAEETNSAAALEEWALRKAASQMGTDPRFFELVIPLVRKKVKSICSHMTSPNKLIKFSEPQVQEDMVQGILLHLIEKTPNYDSSRNEGSIEKWVEAIVRNYVISIRRQYAATKRNHEIVPEMVEGVENVSLLAGDEDSPFQNVAKSEIAAIVRWGMDQLPENQRQIFFLQYEQGLTLSEIATNLQIPLGTVKSRVFAGKKTLEEILRKLPVFQSEPE